jgi:hypothetical protein
MNQRALRNSPGLFRFVIIVLHNDHSQCLLR